MHMSISGSGASFAPPHFIIKTLTGNAISNKGMVQNVWPRQPLLRVFGQQTFQETLKQRRIKSKQRDIFFNICQIN